MAKLPVAKLTATLLALAAAALFTAACSAGDRDAANSVSGSTAPPGTAVTVYSSPT